jgi:hypothetical protein
MRQHVVGDQVPCRCRGQVQDRVLHYISVGAICSVQFVDELLHLVSRELRDALSSRGRTSTHRLAPEVPRMRSSASLSMRGFRDSRQLGCPTHHWRRCHPGC